MADSKKPSLANQLKEHFNLDEEEEDESTETEEEEVEVKKPEKPSTHTEDEEEETEETESEDEEEEDSTEDEEEASDEEEEEEEEDNEEDKIDPKDVKKRLAAIEAAQSKKDDTKKSEEEQLTDKQLDQAIESLLANPKKFANTRELLDTAYAEKHRRKAAEQQKQYTEQQAEVNAWAQRTVEDFPEIFTVNKSGKLTGFDEKSPLYKEAKSILEISPSLSRRPDGVYSALERASKRVSTSKDSVKKTKTRKEIPPVKARSGSSKNGSVNSPNKAKRREAVDRGIKRFNETNDIESLGDAIGEMVKIV